MNAVASVANTTLVVDIFSIHTIPMAKTKTPIIVVTGVTLSIFVTIIALKAYRINAVRAKKKVAEYPVKVTKILMFAEKANIVRGCLKNKNHPLLAADY